MRLRTWYKVHKWVSVAVGVALFLWVFTGLAMILPPSATSRGPRGEPIPDYAGLVVTPAEAVARAVALAGDSSPPREIGFVRVLDRLAYRIASPRREPLLIDARTGERIAIDQALAVQIARAALGAERRIERVEHLIRHSASYLGGALPIYRVRFDNGVALHVDAQDGSVRMRTTAMDRFRGLNAQLHSFGPLRLGPGGVLTQHGSLWLLGVLSGVTVLIGYYLSLPKRWKVRRRPPPSA